MEEIVSANAIRSEILEDARKKAARLLEEADEAAARAIEASEARAVSAVAEISRTIEAGSLRFAMEAMARLPLERTRMRTAFVDARIREALGEYMSSLGDGSVARLAEALLAGGAAFLEGRDVRLARRGLSEAAAGAIAGRALAGAASVGCVEDLSLPAPGLVASSSDGAVVVKATMDLVEDRILDDKRGELARALCAEALAV